MAKHETKKLLMVNVKDIVLNLEENVRDPVKDYETIPELMVDIRDNGQKQAVVLRKLENGELHPLQGFRRISAITRLQRTYPNGFEVVDEKAGTSFLRKFDQVLAEVMENISDEEAFVIKSDSGNTQLLSEVALFRTVDEALSRGKSEKWCTTTLRGAFDNRHPIPAGDVKEMTDKVTAKLINIPASSPVYQTQYLQARDEIYFLYRRGLIQKFNNVFKSPDCVRAAYLDKSRGLQKWPSDKEVADGLKIFEAERNEDKLGISKAHPGPKFMEWWEKLSTAKTSDEANGVRPKAMGMMNRGDVEKIESLLDSKMLKLMVGMILRSYKQDHLPALNKLCTELESIMTSDKPVVIFEQGKKLQEIINAVTPQKATATVDATVEKSEKTETVAA